VTLVGLLFSGLGGSLPAAADPVTVRGLSHTMEDSKLVESAIARANLILSSSGQHLTPSWGDAGTPTEKDFLPVYLVASPPDALSTPAAAPRGCTCVFVNPSLLASWSRAHSSGMGRMEIDRSMLLTFMLLHEVGHIVRGDSAGDFADGAFSQLNTDRTIAKASEEKADEFATGLIRNLIHTPKPPDATLTANWVALELTKLSWNMQAYRTLDEFGAAETGKPSVFFDQSFSHPNLAWRILRSNYLIQQTPETLQLLQSFEQARQRGANPSPLYSLSPKDIPRSK
jgi:hypothetical protein